MVRNNNETGITQILASFASNVNYEDLPPDVVDRAKYFCLDFAGVTLNGSTTDSAKAVVKALDDVGRSGPSTIVGTNKRALPEYAAMANGTAFHSIEMDDVNNEASLHPGVVAFPTALAMADIAPVSGKDFISAVVAGYDVIIRLGRALKPKEHYGRGFHPTGTCGAFGGAAVAARLLGLQGDDYTHALGIAGSQAAGSMEYLAQGAWTKRLHPGWSAHSGIWAALLARAGYSGPTTILEGRDGFLNAYSGDPDPSLVLKDLGEEYQVTRTGVKPHACCRYNQGPIDCLLEIGKSNDFQAMDIEEVKIGVLSQGMRLVAEPVEAKRNPKSVVDMQFSMPFAAAVALSYGSASLNEYAIGIPDRPEVRHIMDRVQCVTDPKLDAQAPKLFPAWAEVRTSNGRTMRSELTYPKGDPENPVTWDEMRTKFNLLSAPVISSQRQGKIISAIDSLEQMDDVRQLASLLSTE
ncbi:MAG TPA: MmgE/PrpD family protein [Dehalococcoidia bacterium]|nr:MmgE/PrpD family protein [Dehalococcoidia bacterium]